ncbi:MAG: isoprenylcysteine carboxylmethyltransferase family protein [Pyrinomonadaceae bacterium]|jgi:protein-S-isoprenylcysteine O-methyltransferase Ste14|nr:isoprenylcysteine carboxylmethyltransferase family protein [Pyrinomonadaceae bacterium]
MTDKKDNPNVIAPPPLIFLSGLVLGGIVTFFDWSLMLPYALAVLLANLLILLGIGVIAIAYLQMRKAKTNIEPWKPTTKILDSGVYKYSRNPIYVAMALIYLGIACLFNSIWFLLFLPICLLVIHFGVILREEIYLENKFGEDYLDYKKRVRRWI